MSLREFFGDEARRAVKQAIEKLEREGSAEVVVSVAPSSGHYRAGDYLWGSFAACVFALVFVFHPLPFDSAIFPLELCVAFGAGTALSAYLLPLRRSITPRSVMSENVLRAAKAKFVDLGIANTRARSGLLLYVSMFERKVAIVADVGVDREAHARTFEEAEQRLVSAVSQADLGAFTVAIVALGPVLRELCPPRSDDVNELPDEPEVA